MYVCHYHILIVPIDFVQGFGGLLHLIFLDMPPAGVTIKSTSRYQEL